MIVYCATSNPGKLREFRLAGETFGRGRLQVETVPGLREIPPPHETGETFEANAIEKALYYARFVDGLLFADDSGLEVDALNGAPGVYSARYAGEGATDRANNELLLSKLRDQANRGAQFVCAIALVEGTKVVNTFQGVVRGRIIDEARGGEGFGYDPLFLYEPFGCTFGEADAEAKMRVSHRAQALAAMFSWLAG